MHNVEFKAELRDLPLARTIARAWGATFVNAVEQVDTYFRIPAGRLKRRECAGEPVEYIFYDRDDRTLPKLSHFTIYTESEAVERFGTLPMPVWLVVKKAREIHLIENVRVHFDTVERLGTFLEFEALVSTSQNVARCHETINKLRRAFDPALGESIACGYSDLLEQVMSETPSSTDSERLGREDSDSAKPQ